MSTAAEMQLRMAEVDRQLAPVRAAIERGVSKFFMSQFVTAFGRRVCARRARKLRRRGCTVRFDHWTARGKCRYLWVPATPIIRIAS